VAHHDSCEADKCARIVMVDSEQVERSRCGETHLNCFIRYNWPKQVEVCQTLKGEEEQRILGR